MSRRVLLIAFAFVLASCVNRAQEDQQPPTRHRTASDAQEDSSRLRVPDGFEVRLLARDLPGATALVFDRLGNLWVSRPEQGRITLLQLSDGLPTHRSKILEGLQQPFGLALHPQESLVLYFSETRIVSRLRLYTEDRPSRVVDLPEKSVARSLGFGPDGRLYVGLSRGVGSAPCGAMYSMDSDGADMRKLWEGAHVPAYFTWSHVDGTMWASMQPCASTDNAFVSPIPDSAQKRTELPQGAIPAGVAYVPEEGWPEDYWYDLVLGMAGANSEPKLVRLKMDARQHFQGLEDFATGWQGHPAGVLVMPGGLMYVSDPKTGQVWRIARTGNSEHPIRVTTPGRGGLVSSPLIVRGEARGSWFFEANFPVQLVDASGRTIAETPARAQGRWMTEDFVPFEARLEFKQPDVAEGELVLKKANASGLPEHDAEVRIPIRFR